MSDMSTMSSDLFTKYVHHQNLSVLYSVQNIFNSAKKHRTLNLNANYIVLFKIPRNKAQVSHLAQQMFSRKPKILHEAFDNATLDSYT